MPNPVADGEIYQVTSVCRLNNQNGLMIWHYATTGVVGTPNQQQLVTAVSERFEASIKALMCTAATLRGFIAQKIKPLPVDSRETTTADAGTGTVAADPMSTQTCGEFALRTALAGRHNRGRKYVPFPAIDDNDEGGHPVESYITRMQTFANLLINPLVYNVAGNEFILVPVIYQRGTGVFQFVTSAAMRIEWATQRRRSQLNRGDEQILL